LNGYEAAQMIRRLPSPVGQIPIIALTASTDAKDVEVCKAAGMNEFFLKSMGEEALLGMLRRYQEKSV